MEKNMHALGDVFVNPTNRQPGFPIVVNMSQPEKLGWRQKLIVVEQTGKTSWCRYTVHTSWGAKGGKSAGKIQVVCQHFQINVHLCMLVVYMFGQVMLLNLQMHDLRAKTCANYPGCNPTHAMVSPHDQVARCSCNSVQVVLFSPLPPPSLHSVLLSTPPTALTCLFTALRLSWREGTFRHMDLPFVYDQLVRGVTVEGTDLWLAQAHPP